MNQTTLQTKTTTKHPVLYVSMELSEKSWGLLFSDGAKTRAVLVAVGDIAAVLEHARKAREKFRLPEEAQLVSCYEAGRDGFWVHRALTAQGGRNLVVDSSSIEVDRRQRRVKTDRVDAEKLLVLLLRYCAGELKALRVVHVPEEEEEDARRRGRERERLTAEKVGHVTRIKALLVLHGVRDVGAKVALEEVRDWKKKPLPEAAKAELEREQERLRLIEVQLKQLDEERESRPAPTALTKSVAQLMTLRGLGGTSARLLCEEFFGWRRFRNRRQVGAAAGLTSVPFNSGFSEREQGISKAGNRRVRTMAVQLAWVWLRYQPGSALTAWFKRKFGEGKRARRVGIVALARRLLVAFWRYLEAGVVPEGATLKTT